MPRPTTLTTTAPTKMATSAAWRGTPSTKARIRLPRSMPSSDRRPLPDRTAPSGRLPRLGPVAAEAAVELDLADRGDGERDHRHHDHGRDHPLPRQRAGASGEEGPPAEEQEHDEPSEDDDRPGQVGQQLARRRADLDLTESSHVEAC